MLIKINSNDLEKKKQGIILKAKMTEREFRMAVHRRFKSSNFFKAVKDS